MRRAAVLVLLCCLGFGSTARADDSQDAAAQSAIRDVISRQLDAFKAGDGAAAEAFASPGIQEKFPGPDVFMGMVRGAYAMLINPRSTHFDELSVTPLGTVQKVTIVDGNGQVWTAAYTMTVVDGQWRISGCSILKSDAVNA